MEPVGQPGLVAKPAKPRHLRDLLRRPGWIISLVVIALAVVVAVLATVPVAKTASFHFGAVESGSAPVSFDDHWSQSLCPSGADVVVSFSSNGLSITFGITAPNGTSIWSQHAPYANASFVAGTCGTYQILATGSGDGSYSVDGALSYSSPIL